MYLGNIVGLIIVLTCVPLFAAILRIPFSIIAPVILVICAIGAYTVHNPTFDVVLMLVFGVVGYVLKKCNYPLAPMVLAIVLGDKAEEAFRQSLLVSQGSARRLLLERAGRHDHGARPDRAVLAADPERLDAVAPRSRGLTHVQRKCAAVLRKGHAQAGSGIDSTSQRCLIWNNVYQGANAPVPRRKGGSHERRLTSGVRRRRASCWRRWQTPRPSRTAPIRRSKTSSSRSTSMSSRVEVRLDERQLAQRSRHQPHAGARGDGAARARRLRALGAAARHLCGAQDQARGDRDDHRLGGAGKHGGAADHHERERPKRSPRCARCSRPSRTASCARISTNIPRSTSSSTRPSSA